VGGQVFLPLPSPPWIGADERGLQENNLLRLDLYEVLEITLDEVGLRERVS